MRTALILSVALVIGCSGGHAEVFSTLCSYGDSTTKSTFSIVADTTKKTGMSDYRNSFVRAVPGKLDIVSVARFEDGLVGVKLHSRTSGATYKVDFVKKDRPKSSPYTTEMESIAITSRDGGTTRESCGIRK